MIDFAPHNISPAGREICLNCPVPHGCVYERTPVDYDACPLPNPTPRRGTPYGERVKTLKTIEALLTNGGVTIAHVTTHVSISRATLVIWRKKGYLESTTLPNPNRLVVTGVNWQKVEEGLGKIKRPSSAR